MSSSPYRVVLVGCGGISKAWMNAVRAHYSERIQFVGLVDLFEESAKKLAEHYELDVPIGSDLPAMLAETKPDLLFNCTIPDAHFETCKAGLEAGCHVLVEKPAAATLQKALELAAISERCQRQLAVIQNRRYLPDQAVLRDLIESGAIGRVHTVCADFYLGPRFGGFREEMQHVLLLDMAIHTFDQARYLTAGRPKTVYCHEFNPNGSWYAHGASAMAIFTLENDITFNYRGSWCALGARTSWNAEWRILGDKGTALWDGEKGLQIDVLNETGQKEGLFDAAQALGIPEVNRDAARMAHAGMIGGFLDAIDTGEPPPTTIADNVFSLAMVEGAIISAEQHRVVDFQELLVPAS